MCHFSKFSNFQKSAICSLLTCNSHVSFIHLTKVFHYWWWLSPPEERVWIDSDWGRLSFSYIASFCSGIGISLLVQYTCSPHYWGRVGCPGRSVCKRWWICLVLHQVFIHHFGRGRFHDLQNSRRRLRSSRNPWNFVRYLLITLDGCRFYDLRNRHRRLKSTRHCWKMDG